MLRTNAFLSISSAIAVLLLCALALAGPQQVSVKSIWTPPPPRREKTPFAPKPIQGDNIFKGEAEVWLANAVEKLEGGILTPVDDRVVIDYVTQVGVNLVSSSVAPKKHCEFIVTTDWTPDAMTAGGGRIYISSGMLEQIQSEDELAGVLAHEIAHDAFAHAAKAVTRQMFWLTDTRKVTTPAQAELALSKLLEEYDKKPLAVIGESLLGFARFDELEADRAAFYNTYRAGYNPFALETVLKRMARKEKEEVGEAEYHRDQFFVLLFGSHPPTEQRSMALSWESNFVKMPAKDSRYSSSAFDAMKRRIKDMSKQE
jgi:predicted Zn-dependent protease